MDREYRVVLRGVQLDRLQPFNLSKRRGLLESLNLMSLWNYESFLFRFVLRRSQNLDTDAPLLRAKIIHFGETLSSSNILGMAELTDQLLPMKPVKKPDVHV